VKKRARTVSYFLSLIAVALIFFSVEFITEKYFYPNDEVVDILAAIIGALSFARCKRFFDCVTDRIFFRAPRDAHTEFITNISHELQTPIAILRGNVELLRRRSITDAERASAERVIITTLDGMSRLVGGVLEGAKIRFSENTAHEEFVAVDALVREVYEDCVLLAENEGIRFSVHVDGFNGESVAVFGDRHRLKEVLFNLISNALKHTPCGGAIALRVERGESAARIVVEDSGRGIAPEALPHIFERFYRIENHAVALADGTGAMPRAPVPSTGIGLNICREIVEAHHGTILAESEPGKGSRFVVQLPVASGAAPPPGIAASAIINS